MTNNAIIQTIPAAPSYTADMPVEEICQKMTMDEARAVVVPTGTCKGWTLAQVAERRRSSLKFYMFSMGSVDEEGTSFCRIFRSTFMDMVSIYRYFSNLNRPSSSGTQMPFL